MQKISTKVEALHRVVAMLVAMAVLAWSVGAYSSAQAANLTFISDTLSDSDVGVTSSHTILFTVPAGSSIASTSAITVTFPAGFTGVASVLSGNIVAKVNAGTVTKANYSAIGQVISFEGATAVAGDVISIAIADSIITNPAVGSYEIYVTAGATDTGRTRVAILNNVLVTAVVDTTFDFLVSGLGTSTAINGTSTTGSTTDTAIPFGTLVAGGIKTMAQKLDVTTNARNGFVVTVKQDGNLQSSTGADVDGFVDGAYTNTPAVWSAPSNIVTNENTWGHWGLTSDDSDLNAGEFTVGGPKFVAASTTPRAIFSHSGPADGTTQDIGTAEVGYQIEITPLQEAGDDYNTILTYVATPTF